MELHLVRFSLLDLAYEGVLIQSSFSFTMSDAGATDRLCAAFKMCEEKPIDKNAVTQYVRIWSEPLEYELIESRFCRLETM